MPQAACRSLPTAAARIRARSGHVGFVVDKVARAGFLRELRFPLPIIIPPNSPSSYSPGPIGGRCAEWTRPGFAPGQVVWNFWWTRWHWGRFSPRTSVSLANHYSTKFSIFIITRANWWPQCRVEPIGLHPPLQYTNYMTSTNFALRVIVNIHFYINVIYTQYGVCEQPTNIFF
jgi:hypothetical protein